MKRVYTVEEKTNEFDDNFSTFMVCSTIQKAMYVKNLYEKNYPQNKYKIGCHIIDDQRLIDMEEKC